MRTVVLGTLVGAGMVMLAVSWFSQHDEALAQSPGPYWSNTPGGELIAVATTVADKFQQLTVIDPKRQVMSVYHVELATGKIELCSVRNFQWDLQMTHLNGVSPLPQEIKSLLEQ